MSATTRVLRLEEMDARIAHEVFRLRQQVFVVEQGDPYDDLDGRDAEPGTRHVLLHEGSWLVGVARVLDDLFDGPVDNPVDGPPAGAPVWRIGRFALDPSARGRGLSDPLMTACLEVCEGRPTVLAAQTPLAGFYAAYGFEVCGEEFLDGRIPHLPMLRPRADRGPGPAPTA